MAVVTFDGANRRIIEISASGDNSITWVDIYQDWKAWAKLTNNLGNDPAFRVVGGDPTTGVESLGSTFFLEAGWKFRPSEENHRVEIVGNIVSVVGERVTADTLGAYTVEVALKFTNLIDRLTELERIRPAIYPLYAGL